MAPPYEVTSRRKPFISVVDNTPQGVRRGQGNRLAKQDVRQKSLRKGLGFLRSEGISVEDPSPSAVEVLKGHFGTGKEVDLALVYLLSQFKQRSTNLPFDFLIRCPLFQEDERIQGGRIGDLTQKIDKGKIHLFARAEMAL